MNAAINTTTEQPAAEMTAEIKGTNVAPMPTPQGVAPLVAMLASGQLRAEHVEQALALQKQHDEYDAKRAFSVALARFRSQVRNVVKDRKGHNGMYATLGAIADAVAQPLAENGLSYYWTDAQDGASLTVTCHLSHELGHEITTTLTSGPDAGGAKSPIQALASARSYLCRYTLSGLLGIATEDDDAEKTKAPVEMLSTADYAVLKDRVVETGGSVERWEAHIKATYPNGIPKAAHAKVSAGIEAAKTTREKVAAEKAKVDAKATEAKS